VTTTRPREETLMYRILFVTLGLFAFYLSFKIGIAAASHYYPVGFVILVGSWVLLATFAHRTRPYHQFW
jgi:hypothetical protein